MSHATELLSAVEAFVRHRLPTANLGHVRAAVEATDWDIYSTLEFLGGEDTHEDRDGDLVATVDDCLRFPSLDEAELVAEFFGCYLEPTAKGAETYRVERVVATVDCDEGGATHCMAPKSPYEVWARKRMQVGNITERDLVKGYGGAL